jgi:tryptophan synthase alpha chain
MSRIKELFSKKNAGILNVFCTAGFPSAGSTMEVIESLQQSGVDMVEIGMPYSDPLADGPVIQQTNAIALANGMTINKLFGDLKELRSSIGIPVVLMGYFNPVLQYGFDKFCKKAAAVGIDGLIIPDLPDLEFEREYGAVIKQYGLDFIFLVTPETSMERVKKLDQLSSGFLYAVASSSITGSDHQWENVISYLQRLSTYKLKNPVLLGFGIKDHKSFSIATAYANGAIIGTAYVKALEAKDDIGNITRRFIEGIKFGVNN